MAQNATILRKTRLFVFRMPNHNARHYSQEDMCIIGKEEEKEEYYARPVSQPNDASRTEFS